MQPDNEGFFPTFLCNLNSPIVLLSSLACCSTTQGVRTDTKRACCKALQIPAECAAERLKVTASVLQFMLLPKFCVTRKKKDVMSSEAEKSISAVRCEWVKGTRCAILARALLKNCDG